MDQRAIDLEAVFQIEDFSNETLLGLAERLEQSGSFQACLAREIELDEVWRRVDAALKLAEERGEDPRPLTRLFDLVFQAHDLAGEEKSLEAAGKLREAMTG